MTVGADAELATRTLARAAAELGQHCRTDGADARAREDPSSARACVGDAGAGRRTTKFWPHLMSRSAPLRRARPRSFTTAMKWWAGAGSFDRRASNAHRGDRGVWRRSLGLNKHVVIGGLSIGLRTRCGRAATQRFDDCLHRSQYRRELAHGLVDGIGHEVAGALQRVKNVGEHPVKADWPERARAQQSHWLANCISADCTRRE